VRDDDDDDDDVTQSPVVHARASRAPREHIRGCHPWASIITSSIRGCRTVGDDILLCTHSWSSSRERITPARDDDDDDLKRRRSLDRGDDVVCGHDW